ncbi:hypothetical protein O6H91_04G074700 [Diphasiastrum complanatum]|uniref:Uncharacterized protein n=1 Tax=Diphasiastrum complanatum TaxID=34168 RepID=A0ACC2DYG3_DIPCM|nr:hypothetical protein O6H91_04G074700 [Diphasiastrum complanatum]
MASAIVFTAEYQKQGALSFDSFMKKPKSSKGYNAVLSDALENPRAPPSWRSRDKSAAGASVPPARPSRLPDRTVHQHSSAAAVDASEAVADSDGMHHGRLYTGVHESMPLGYPKSQFESGYDESKFKRKSVSLNANVLQESDSAGVVRRANLSSLSKEERRELRKKLRLDLEQVRSLSLKLEAKEHQLKSVSHSMGFHTSHSDAHLSRTENRCSMEKEVTSEPPVTPAGNIHFAHNSRLGGEANFLLTEGIGTPGAIGKEKRTPKANQLYLNSEFLSGKDRMPPPEKLKPKVASGAKRSQGKDEDLDLKWQKIQLGRSKRMADIMKQCGTVLKKLMTHKHGWVFNAPVDAVKLRLPDYHKVIKKPMDLGTVKKKFESGQYQSPMEFAEDVRLTFSNAMKYNPKENDVHAMADILRKIFEERWKSIKEKLEEESLKMRVEDETHSERQGKGQQLQDLQRHLRSIEDQINSFTNNSNSKHMAPARSVAPSTQRKVPKREMTFAQKSQLSVNLERLPGDKTQEIIQIIKRRNPSLSQSQIGDASLEIEVDIDAVDNDTLWELHKYVTNCMKNVKKTRKRPTEAKAMHHIQAGSDAENAFGHGDTTSVIKNRKNDVVEEDVDIDDDMPSAKFPPVVVEKDAVEKSSSSSSSSSDSGSSSSDSDSGSSSGSESDAGDIQSGGPMP